MYSLKLKDFSDTVTNRRKFGYRVESEAYEWVFLRINYNQE